MPHRQTLDPKLTTWHITFGTYGARLHGGFKATVDKDHNQRGQPFLQHDPQREQQHRDRMNSDPTFLTDAQRRFIQQTIPALCDRGGWRLRGCAAGKDHVHVQLDADPQVHGEKIRRLLKRWLTQALNETFDKRQWWAEEGSNKPVKDESYLNNTYRYILRQRAK